MHCILQILNSPPASISNFTNISLRFFPGEDCTESVDAISSQFVPWIYELVLHGHTPARFEIQKMRLLYLKYILEEDDESSLSKFFQLQLEFPTKGDWASTCQKDLEELRIEKSLEDIKLMGKRQFKKILIENGRENAFKYLISKKGSKGK